MATRPPRIAADPEGEILENNPSESNAGTMRQPSGDLVSSRVTDDDELSITDRVRAMLGETPSDKARVRLYRIDSRNATLQHCRVYLPQEFEAGDLDGIRNEWGPGDYEIRITDRTGIIGKSRVSIAAPLVTAATPQRNDDGSNIAQLLRAMQDSQAAQMRALQEALTANRPDPTASLAQAIALVGQLREVIAPANASPAAVAPPDPMAMFTQVMSMVRESRATIKELVEEEGPKRDPENPLSMVGDIVELVKLGMSQNAQQPSGGFVALPPVQVPPSVRSAAPQVEAAAPVETSPAPENNESPMQIIIRGLVEDLCAIAERGDPPTVGAEFIFEKLPDEALPYMNHRLWFEALAASFGVIRKHETWIREAKKLADDLFAQDAARPDED